MSDSNNPPDDFSATTPNIKVPKKDSPDYGNAPSNDWEKTNYNYSAKELGKDDWNKTAFNVPKSPQAIPPDFDKTSFGAQPPAKDGEWGMTQANIDLPTNRSSQYDNPMYDDYGSKDSDYGKTSVGIKLPKNDAPRNEEPKYQEPVYQDPHKKETVEEKKEETSGSKSRGWLWASLGLLSMFFFALVVLVGVYFLFSGKTGFEIVVKSVPANSDVLIDNSFWGVTDSDGTIVLKTLRAGQTKKIEIRNPGFLCNVKEIGLDEAQNGASVTRTAECQSTGVQQPKDPKQGDPPIDATPKDCQPKFAGDYETSRNCALTEIGKIENDDKNGKTFTVKQLLYAMNLYIIQFDKNKFNIKPVDNEFITRAANLMKKLPAQTKIEVGGHTDSDGNPKSNEVLSRNRATSVRNALVKNGVPSSMLQTMGYGATQPVAPNDTEDNKFRNRRIAYSIR